MRQVFLLIILLSRIMCFGQEIENDISVKTYAVPDSVNTNPSNYNVSDALCNFSNNSYLNEFPKPISEFDSLMYFTPINTANFQTPSGSAIIPLWKNAQFIATGNIRDLPGLMQIHSGSIGINQNIGNFSFYMGGVVKKYGYFNGLHTQYGVSGNIRYHISPQITLTAFGTYYLGKPKGFPMLPSMIGYYGVSNFGGYMSYQFNETFGVDVGAQTVQQFGTNRYRVEPIVTPTVKVGKVKFGIPVGQILYDVIRSQAEQRHYRK